jgi:hypothetical protein
MQQKIDAAYQLRIPTNPTSHSESKAAQFLVFGLYVSIAQHSAVKRVLEN